jgi:DNA (cytosine-5)-methyltransferase 1
MLKAIELFGGIGAFRKAMGRSGIDFKIVDYVEIDKFAVTSYNAMYDENYEVQDVSEWDKDMDVDIIFHGSPCQDFSLAGKQAGGHEGSGTRSSLLFETVRIVAKTKPKYVIWENVKNVLGKKHKPVFDKYLIALENLGYTNFYQVLNTKNYGIPQNRERVFCISIKGEAYFNFPKPIELVLNLEDLLEDQVDAKYYLSEEQINRLVVNKNWNVNPSGRGMNGKVHHGDLAPTLTTNKGEGHKIAIAGQIQPQDRNYKKNNKKRVVQFEPRKDKVSNAILTTSLKNMVAETLCINSKIDGKQPSLQDRIYDAKGISTAITTSFHPAYVINNKGTSPAKGVYLDQLSRGKAKVTGNVAPTIKAQSGHAGVILGDYTFRKLIPLECWRLQGFDDATFNKAAQVCSNSQLYKQAGNSITVNVLEYIFRNLFLGVPQKQLFK